MWSPYLAPSKKPFIALAVSAQWEVCYGIRFAFQRLILENLFLIPISFRDEFMFDLPGLVRICQKLYYKLAAYDEQPNKLASVY